MVGDLFAGERLQRCQKALLMGEFLTVCSLLIGYMRVTWLQSYSVAMGQQVHVNHLI